ncbi:MAG TPA: helix-turn-helix domain-containing protein [Saprospiraceae bacterium]|nr:helix-turn-helix domain-containing protein [Saprospiraceae bacterium]
MYLIENVKHLRKIHGLTQQDLSEQLMIPRSTLGEYERGNTEPSLDLVIKISKLFKVEIDRLLKYKISDTVVDTNYLRQTKVLAVTLGQSDQTNIELVNTKAEAGYLDSYSDPEFIKDLPKIHFPNLPRGHYRGFEISGDSMLPIESGSIVICRYIEHLNEIKDNKTYVVISKREGVVYKRVRNVKEEQKLTLISDNESYLPYALPYTEIDELWQYHAHLSFSDSKTTFNSMLEDKINQMSRQISEIHEKIVH